MRRSMSANLTQVSAGTSRPNVADPALEANSVTLRYKENDIHEDNTYNAMFDNNKCICTYKSNCHTIKSLLEEERFWHLFKIIKAKPDDHCIIHATAH